MSEATRTPQGTGGRDGGEWRGRNQGPPPGTPPSSNLPPQNIEAEEAILGAMMVSQVAREIAVDAGLRETDFYRPSHRTVFAAIQRIPDQDHVDELVVINELKRHNELDEVGGKLGVLAIAERVPAAANARAYAEEVIRQSTLRRLVETGYDIARLGHESPDDPGVLIDTAGTMISDLSQQRDKGDFIRAADLLGDIYDEITERAESGGAPRGVPTGFSDFDAMTGGLQKDQLIIVAARPAMGKTSWALNVAEHVALREKRPIAVFSLEMSPQDLVVRMMCSVARVDQKRIRIGVPRETDWPLLVDAVGKLMQTRDHFFIDESSGLTPMELRTKTRRLHHQLRDQGGLAMVIVDYLQLMEPGKRVDSHQVGIAYISRQLKMLAMELHIPVIALSQLSRASEARSDKRPMLSDLRDSGAIEQDADIVLFLHRPEYYERDKPELQGLAELIIAKHRNGEVGSVWMGFFSKYTQFVNLEKNRTPPPAAMAGQPLGAQSQSYGSGGGGQGGGSGPGSGAPGNGFGGGGGYSGPPPQGPAVT